MQPPCSAKAVANHLSNMLRIAALPSEQLDPQEVTAEHLNLLNFPVHWSSYQHLRVGVPLFSQDTHQSLSKELYPAIAAICGNDNKNQVESAIRNSIKKLWKNRNVVIWEKYFPSFADPLSNKEFFAGWQVCWTIPFPLNNGKDPILYCKQTPDIFTCLAVIKL